MHHHLLHQVQHDQPLTVGIVHASPIVVAGIQAWLESRKLAIVVCVAHTATTGLAVLTALQPKITLLDASLPGMGGIVISRQLRDACVPTAIILINTFPQQIMFEDALKAGIRGLVLQNSAPDYLALAIQTVQKGGISIDPGIAAAFFENGTVDGLKSPTALTHREKNVLRAVAYGFSIKEIAANMGITAKSVETYKTRACDKLGLNSRAQIVRHALRQGWFDVTEPEVAPCFLIAQDQLRTSQP